MAKMEKMARVKMLEGLIIESPKPLADLAKEIGVSHDTIRRDIAVLREAGSDVKYTDDGWFARKTVFTSNLKLRTKKSDE